MANSRVIAFMRELGNIMKSQRDRGSSFLIGDSITAADFFWAAFSNFVSIQPPHICPINPAARPMFENTADENVKLRQEVSKLEEMNANLHKTIDLLIEKEENKTS